MVWLCGPPWWPGNTDWLIGPSRLYMMSLPFLSWLRTPGNQFIDLGQGGRREKAEEGAGRRPRGVSAQNHHDDRHRDESAGAIDDAHPTEPKKAERPLKESEKDRQP